jgi:hypothetical protein
MCSGAPAERVSSSLRLIHRRRILPASGLAPSLCTSFHPPIAVIFSVAGSNFRIGDKAMASDYPPFMNSYGLVAKILNKIKDAKTPDRFTQDYLGSTLGFASGCAKPFIPVIKRLGLLSSDGAPTELYKQFRNPDHSKSAMGKAIKQRYAALYERNETVHSLDKKSLEGLIVQATGLDQGASTLRAIVGTFESLKAFASFDKIGESPTITASNDKGGQEVEHKAHDRSGDGEEIRLGDHHFQFLLHPRSNSDPILSTPTQRSHVR